MKIEWAPVRLPNNRRAQTFAITFFAFILFTVPVLGLVLTIYGLFYAGVLLKILTIAYLTQIYYNHKANFSDLRGNGWKICRQNYIWRKVREYFPVDLVKTVDLKPDKNYLIANFPHGVVGFASIVNMSLDIAKWKELYPGIRPKVATLNIHFMIPIWRDFVRSWGGVSVSKDSLLYYLSKSTDHKHPENLNGFTSTAVIVVVGGAQESLEARPGNYVITLRERKGFVRVAIKTGAHLVPSFSFGEVDLYDQLDNPPKSLVRTFQVFIKKMTGISPLFFNGRGIFQYSFGILPRRASIVQVVGAPIEIIQSDKPSDEYVDEIHATYMTALIELFEKYKGKYLKNPETELIIQ